MRYWFPAAAAPFTSQPHFWLTTKWGVISMGAGAYIFTSYVHSAGGLINKHAVLWNNWILNSPRHFPTSTTVAFHRRIHILQHPAGRNESKSLTAGAMHLVRISLWTMLGILFGIATHCAQPWIVIMLVFSLYKCIYKKCNLNWNWETLRRLSVRIAWKIHLSLGALNRQICQAFTSRSCFAILMWFVIN